MDELRDLYEARAAQQYAAPVALPDPGIDRKFRKICELVREQLPCEAFLDAGCGDGRYLAALAAELPARRAGVDLSSRILETAAQRVEADYRQASLESLPFDDGSFDLVLCTQVIEHVPRPELAVFELARVLRPGGRLVISTDNERNRITRALNAPRTLAVGALRLRGARGRIESPATPYTAASFRTLVEGAGLTVERLETFRFHLMWPFAAPRLVRALNRLDERLPPHQLGDIVVAVARR
ncbi:MAG TPA: class I SAM-dependent methyltransferase [Gaiellaceae bacterium]|nr:class I SAM-dependent methyltransferase [Gaiellaceae bacterium]